MASTIDMFRVPAKIRQAPMLRPMMNIGGLCDISTGSYYVGKDGELVLQGGLSHVTMVVGKGNTFKTVFLLFMMLSALNRYRNTFGIVYDTEVSMVISRIQNLIVRLSNLAGKDIQKEGIVSLTSKVEYSGNEYYAMLKEIADDRFDNQKELMVTTPFLDENGKNIKVMSPMMSLIDSFSQFSTDGAADFQEQAIGSSKRNMEAMRDSHAKDQLVRELPVLTAKNNVYVMMSAHLGKQHSLDGAPPSKVMHFLKQGFKIKNVTEKVEFLINNMWGITGATNLLNNDKMPEYPLENKHAVKGDTDLMEITGFLIRSKHGRSGFPLSWVVSQSQGFMEELTDFHHCKTNGRFGMGGNLVTYHMELLPEVNLSRTTVRRKIDEVPELARVLKFTSELHQIQTYWADTNPPEWMEVTPKSLYEGLKAKGYDWKRLLDTRGHWVPLEHEKGEKPYLSTGDLINMLHGKYHPKWYGELKA